MFICINNILIYSNIIKKYCTTIYKIYKKFKKEKLFTNSDKFCFLFNNLKILKYIISIIEIKAILKKIHKISKSIYQNKSNYK